MREGRGKTRTGDRWDLGCLGIHPKTKKLPVGQTGEEREIGRAWVREKVTGRADSDEEISGKGRHHDPDGNEYWKKQTTEKKRGRFPTVYRGHLSREKCKR